MIVVVPDVNPVQTLLQQDCFVGWDLQELWDDSVEKAVGIIGAVHPDLCLAKYSCLSSSDAWLDDGIIGQFIQYRECGMPLAATAPVTAWIPDPPFFKQKNSIDYGELLILDPTIAFKINAAHESGQWEPVLRIISVKCTFANVKRILLPINVANSDGGYCIAGSGNGIHFILTEVNLVNDATDFAPCLYLLRRHRFRPVPISFRTIMRCSNKAQNSKSTEWTRCAPQRQQLVACSTIFRKICCGSGPRSSRTKTWPSEMPTCVCLRG